MDFLRDRIRAAGLGFYETGMTALDAYFGLKNPDISFLLVEGGIVNLARLADNLRFPGLPYADASVLEGNSLIYITCAESLREAERHAFTRLDIFRDPVSRRYHDPYGVYPSLRTQQLEARPASPEQALFEAAVLVSRQECVLPEGYCPPSPASVQPAWQRDLLQLILTGNHPERGLELLKSSGFIEAHWPDLARLSDVDHAKDMHPEGDGWAHTLETMRYRKLPDLRLSLALLLHDTGKARASNVEGRKFDRHAEIGAGMARRFLARLGFEPALVDDVAFLIRYHMMPAALPRLPLNRVDGIIDDPRFPMLLELYKCDELSCFRGPEGYYEACAAYRTYLRNVKNPYREADGRLLAKTFL